MRGAHDWKAFLHVQLACAWYIQYTHALSFCMCIKFNFGNVFSACDHRWLVTVFRAMCVSVIIACGWCGDLCMLNSIPHITISSGNKHVPSMDISACDNLWNSLLCMGIY